MTINPNRKCSQDSCNRFSYARGWCNIHLDRARLPDGTIGDTTFDVFRECIVCSKDTSTFKRFCQTCVEEIPEEERRKRYKAWHREQNIDDYTEKAKQRRKNLTPDQSRFYNLKYNYGITYEEFKDLEQRQENSCAICKKPEHLTPQSRLHIDHDHETGKVRGLLCMSCNTGLGHLKDDIELLRNSIKYLEQSKGE